MTTPIVALHGFAGHADSWTDVRAALAAPHHLEAITLYGHDPTSPARAVIAFEAEVARVAERIRALGRPVRLCGYSMGGRIALGVVASVPEHVASLVLVGAHPGLQQEEERRQRAAADAVWARVLEEEGIDVFLSKWQAQPLFASQAGLDPARLARQRAIRARHDPVSLAFAMTSLGLAAMPSWWSMLERVEVPIELVVGQLDEKFATLARSMQARIPPGRATVVEMPNCGHNVVLEQPEALAMLLMRGVQ